MTLQTLKGWRDVRENLQGATQKFVQDYSAVKDDLSAAERSIATLLETIEGLKPLYGAQAPEGNVTSNASQIYFDTTSSPTSVTMYFNDSVGVDTGWVQIS